MSYRRTSHRAVVPGGVVTFLLLATVSFSPSHASALTVQEIQGQIQSLLGQVAAFSAPAAPQYQQDVVSSTSQAVQHRVCSALYRNLYRGMRGEDVFALQDFLFAQGYLSVKPTGYYGTLTAQAVARWQASQGISAVGTLGPITRARVAAWCGISTPAPSPVPAPTPTPASDPSSDPRCKSWYDGCNDCARQYPGGPAMCTLRACFWQAPAYCKEYFDGGANRPPVISGFSGPTTLGVNQTGTWAVQASDPENGPLSYHVVWGDEMYAAPMMAGYATEAFVQTTTFTHAYARAGTYTVIVHVRDSSGQQAQTTTTVRVESGVGYCTMEYAPVCGQPPEPACRYTQPYCMLPTPGPQTYGNRCMLNAAGATFLYEGECRSY